MELKNIAMHLETGGQALILALEKIEREWIPGISTRNKLSITKIISRDGHSVLRLAT
jgi:hypothetical protein